MRSLIAFAVALCLCSGNSHAEDGEALVIKSYFGKGFGLLTANKVIFKLKLPDPRSKRPRPPTWYAFRVVAGKDVEKDDPGVEVAFFHPEVEKACKEWVKKNGRMAIRAVGHETIEASGEPGLSSEVDSNEAESIQDYGWNVRTVFVLRSLGP